MAKLFAVDDMLRRQVEACLELATATQKMLKTKPKDQVRFEAYMIYCPGDAPFVVTADGLEVCADGDANNGKYDVWGRPVPERVLTIIKPNLDLGQAVAVLVAAATYKP